MAPSRSDGAAPHAAPFAVLFVCTHNSARSLMAEAILNRRAFTLDRPQRLRAFSAGAHPAAAPHPLALETLRRFGYTTAFAKPMCWREFARAAAPRIDLLLYLCDDAAAAPELRFAAQPLSAFWPTPDPADAPGGLAARRAAFLQTFETLERRITALLAEDERAGPLREAGAAQVLESVAAIGGADPSANARITS